jgi:hypothetical protein
MKILVGLLAATVLLGVHAGADAQTKALAGIIERFEVVSSVDAYGGATPVGAAGPYVVITGVVHGELNPASPANADIVDLKNAPVGSDGYVAYTTDVVILRPKSATNARRVLFYDVANRGGKIALQTLIGGGALVGGAAPDADFPSLLRAGYTVVWSGWQGDVALSGAGATAALGTRFPIAVNKDGTSITGLSREEYISDAAGGPTIPLTYLPASMSDRSEVVFTARETWLDAAGKSDYASPSAPVTDWSYVTNPNGSVSVRFTPPATVPLPDGTSISPDAGAIYTFIYRAKDPKVMGIGFAAVRDLISFLRNAPADAGGAPNPLNDLKAAKCALGDHCPANPSTNFDVALGEGVSQSGRFLRDFLYLGFNDDGDGHKVFDGLMPVVPGARRTWVDWRFAQAGRWSKAHEDHWMPGDQFPFGYATLTDPVSGRTDGLMKRCEASRTCPKIMQIDGAFEWWGGRASLVVTDGAGHDVALPDNVRYYLVAGTQHGGGAGITSGVVTQPAAGSMCQFAPSPVSETPVERALIPALETWVVNNIAPPPSQYPTVASGDLVPSDRASIGFPDLSAVIAPSGATATPTPLSVAYTGAVNQLFVTDYSAAAPRPDLNKRYVVLEPRVDANGNETSGVRMPELSTPLATYTGWNLRAAGHAAPENCFYTGSAIPLAISAAAKARGDPRAT